MIAVAVVGVGATVVHVTDILQEGNLAPGNSIQNVGNLLKPALADTGAHRESSF